jgi:PPM family protein phosphatase
VALGDRNAVTRVLTLGVGAASHRGNRRELNQDSALVTPGMLAVADGMGGHAAGEVASQLVVARLALLAAQVDLTPEDVTSAIEEVNDEILASAAAHSGRAGMGTTLAGIGVVRVGGSDHWIVFNVGDSRVYRFAHDGLTQVTVDHSEVEELLAAGQITAEQARIYPRRNVITRSLGSDPAPIADVWVFPPTPGERFLICSDGLPLEVDDAVIGQILRAQREPQRAADLLVERAVSAGGRDNVTAVVVDLAVPTDATDVSADTT